MCPRRHGLGVNFGGHPLIIRFYRVSKYGYATLGYGGLSFCSDGCVSPAITVKGKSIDTAAPLMIYLRQLLSFVTMHTNFFRCY